MFRGALANDISHMHLDLKGSVHAHVRLIERYGTSNGALSNR
jgi:hypothetical protein